MSGRPVPGSMDAMDITQLLITVGSLIGMLVIFLMGVIPPMLNR